MANTLGIENTIWRKKLTRGQMTNDAREI